EEAMARVSTLTAALLEAEDEAQARPKVRLVSPFRTPPALRVEELRHELGRAQLDLATLRAGTVADADEPNLPPGGSMVPTPGAPPTAGRFLPGLADLGPATAAERLTATLEMFARFGIDAPRPGAGALPLPTGLTVGGPADALATVVSPLAPVIYKL